MSIARRIACWIGGAEAVEAETRQWQISCTTCQKGANLWDAGGVRYKGRGTKRTRGWCRNCGASRVMDISKADDTA